MTLYRLEANFTDGTVVTHHDYVQAFHDIQDSLNRGKHMSWYAAIGEGDRHDIDFLAMPDNARPIHYVEREKTWNVETGEVLTDNYKQFFGYQFTAEGKNHKEIKEL